MAIEYFNYDNHLISYIAHPTDKAAGLPIFFIHGLTASVHFWEAALFPEIREGHDWYSLSLPLHYPSSYRGELSPESLTEDGFAALYDALIRSIAPQGKVILVGYSVGGFAALNYAAKYPEKVDRVVSIGGFLTGKAKGLEGVLQYFSKGRRLRRWLFWGSWKLLQSHPFFLYLAVLYYAKNDRQLKAYGGLQPTLDNIWPDVQRHDIGYMRAWFDYLLRMDLLDEDQNIEAPVLAFAGESDPIIPYAHQAKYAALLPDCQLISLPGVGHLPFAEAPETFRRELLQFLEDAPGS